MTCETPREAMEVFRQQVGEIHPPVRMVKEPEGWPQVLGRHGRMEWHDGVVVAAFTTGRLIRGKLLALPGVRRHQTGDRELRVLVEPHAIPAVAELLRLRRKRVLTGEALGRARRAAEIGLRRAAQVRSPPQSGGAEAADG